MRRSYVIKTTMLLSLLFGAVLLQSCGSKDSSLVGYIPPSEKQVSTVTATEVTDDASQDFQFIAPSGEVLVVYFGYTNCPDLCPTTLAAVRSAKRDIGSLADQVNLAMVTVDPERDTKDILPAYLSSRSDTCF